MLTTEGAPVIEVRVELVPFPNYPSDNYSKCFLKAKFPLDYPQEIPTLTVEKGKGLSEENIKEIQNLVEKKVTIPLSPLIPGRTTQRNCNDF